MDEGQRRGATKKYGERGQTRGKARESRPVEFRVVLRVYRVGQEEDDVVKEERQRGRRFR